MINLYRYPERYAIVSLDRCVGEISAPTDGFYTCIRDKNELTMIVPEEHLPQSPKKVARGYRVVMLDTELPFDVIGVLAKCSSALAEAGIPIMAFSSYQTDIFLFQESHYELACRILEGIQL